MRILLLATAALLSTPALATNIVTNPGFESALTGWTGPTGNTGFSSISTASHTGRFAYRNGAVGSFGTISQVLPTVAGRTYAYSFWLTNEGGPVNAFEAKLGSTVLVSLTNSASFGFTQFSGTRVAAAANETLSFSFRQDPSFWRLDTISVEAIPEPQSWALLIAGFGLVGAAARRRRAVAA